MILKNHNFDEKDYDQCDPQQLYGLEDEFTLYIKRKISITRKKKNRGILISYYKYNEDFRIDKLLLLIKYGLKVILVCDAGTPTLSDPGYKLVNACLNQGIKIDSLPGPSSITTALSSSGFPADRFCFEGYLPKSLGEKLEKLEKIKFNSLTCVIFESPHRLLKTLLQIEKIFGDRQMLSVHLEMTKLYEKIYRKPIRELYEELTSISNLIKGEITIVIAPYTEDFNDALKQIGDPLTDINLKQEDDIYKIDASVLAHTLQENLDVSERDLAELLQKILKISRSKSTKLSINAIHKDKGQGLNKLFDADTLKLFKKQ